MCPCHSTPCRIVHRGGRGGKGPCHSTPTKSYGTCFIGEEEGEWSSRGPRVGCGVGCGRLSKVGRKALKVERSSRWKTVRGLSFGWIGGVGINP